ncbi:hypothetical protein JKP88DRAFT_256370 [Tribonema minus]|uniref:Trichome birefringence-like C-terminal domain-containing protein n=1 Tax=Tribonema minus TaxID=303371 RepID=A0A836CRQ4_9STRA|nr:hypothetical protein JKP88DRAFT_256370 [Tribonema minus]
MPDLSDPRIAAVDVAQAPYWNLTCPWEWSKYSCAHQEQAERARAALLYSRDILEGGGCTLDPFDGEAFIRLLGTRKLVFAGDSLSRQNFISTACLLHASPRVAVVEDRIKWYTDWPCHGTRNCIRGGAHSGFIGGCVRFALDGESDAGELTVCFNPAERGVPVDAIAARHALVPRRDVLVANLGTHMRKNEQAPHVRQVLDKWTAPADAARLPLLIYRETAPQHFRGTSPAGEYDAVAAIGAACQATIDLDAYSLSTPERRGLAGRVPFVAANPWSAEAGALHVAAGVLGVAKNTQDCTHWCLPGVPDVWSAQLFNYLRAHLAALEAQEFAS